MEIDIISYTSAQYAELTTEQILEVRSAQEKKNKIKKRLQEALLDAEKRHIENGTYHSWAYRAAVANLQMEYEQEVEKVREALLFFLQYASKPEQEKVEYNLDYSLSYVERETRVREFYLERYTDPKERFDVYKEDKVALQYLGERYAPLYDYFYVLMEGV